MKPIPRPVRAPSRDVLLSGCSGGGKSTLLAELARRGFVTVEEPGRRIVVQEQAGEGRALPWVDLAAFVERALALAADDRAKPFSGAGWRFFDRGLIDAAVALEQTAGRPAIEVLAPFKRYHARVFLAPPWPEIFATDPERRHSLGEAISEYERLVAALSTLGYEIILLPKVSVAERTDFVLAELARARASAWERSPGALTRSGRRGAW